MRQTRSWLARPTFAFLFALVAVVVSSALALSVARSLEDRRHLVTGQARWIWLTKDLKAPVPMHFFATQDFEWGGTPAAPARALLFVDRRFVLFFNGVRVGTGQQKPGDPLAAYDLSALIRTGRNHVEIEAESPDGAGGILFSLNLPAGLRIVSDGSWRVARSREELLAGKGTPAVVWGRPPMYPWGYPPPPQAGGSASKLDRRDDR